MKLDRLLNAHKLSEPMQQAVRMVFAGETAYAAAKATGTTRGGISRALAKIRAATDEKGHHVCPACKRP
jgi:hypothetical protein